MVGRFRGLRGPNAVGSAVLVLAVILVACGGGDGGGGAGSKAEWESENGDLVAAYSRSLDDALNNINQGVRANTVGSCTQVADDSRELNAQAFPVPNPAVDSALRSAVDNGAKAAASCLSGSGAGGARDIEKAQVEFADARKSMDAAVNAIAAWS